MILYLLYRHNEWICRDRWRMTITLGYINIILFILLGVKASVVWDRKMDRGWWIETVILTYNFFFSWPYHIMLSSRPYIFSFDKTYSTTLCQEAAWPLVAMLLCLPTQLTTVSWHCQTAIPTETLMWASAYIIS